MKKQILFVSIFIASITASSQNKEGKPFFTTTISSTFGVNEEYGLTDDEDQLFIIPSAILIRTGFGYQIDKRWATSINVGFDHHFRYAINASPTFASVRYNLTNSTSEALFIETGYGKM